MFYKKVFLKISQKSQKHSCARVFFLIKMQAWVLKKKSLVWVFSCEYCEIFKNTYFEEHLRKAASEANQFLAARQLVIKKL